MTENEIGNAIINAAMKVHSTVGHRAIAVDAQLRQTGGLVLRDGGFAASSGQGPWFAFKYDSPAKWRTLRHLCVMGFA